MSDFDALRNALEVVTVQEEVTFNVRPSTDVTGEILAGLVLGAVSGAVASPVVLPGSYIGTSDSGKVATDDKFGNIIGDVNLGGTIDYATGMRNFAFDDGAASTTCTSSYTQIGVAGDVVALSGRADFNDAKEILLSAFIDNNNMPNDSQDVTGSSEGSLPLAVRLNNSLLSTFGLIGNNDLVIKNLFGTKSYVAETTILANWVALDTGDLAAGGGTGRGVGDLICVKLSVSANAVNPYEVGLITAIAGDTITVSPPFSVMPKITDEVPAITSFDFTAIDSDPATLWINLFRGNKLYFPFGGQRVESLEFSFPISDFIAINASLAGAKAYKIGRAHV